MLLSHDNEGYRYAPHMLLYTTPPTLAEYVYYNQRSFKTYFLSFNSLMAWSCQAVTKDSCSGLASHSYLGEVLPVDDMKAHMEVEVQLHPFFPLALDRGDWLFHALTTLLSRRSPRNQWLHAGWDPEMFWTLWRKNISLDLAGNRTLIPRSCSP